jgi:uncharacterized protein (DUF849 family)
MRRIKAAVNGGRARSESAAVPVTPEQIAADARDAIAAGAFAVHVHPRDANGRESLVPEDVAAVVTAAPRGVFGVTTGEWIEPDTGKRLALIERWTALPDFASVNMNESGAIEAAEMLISRGVAVEAGLATVEAAELMMRSQIFRKAIRVLLEPQEQTLAEALATVDAIEEIISACDLPRLLHGVERTAWPLLAEAARRGWDSRIGFEDTLALPDGSPATTNAQLLAAAGLVIAGCA